MKINKKIKEKSKLKSNRGITLITVVVTVIVLAMLSSATVYSIVSAPKIQEYNKMRNDIEVLRGKVLMYYNKYRTIPNIPEEITSIPVKIKNNDNNEGVYYEINIHQLENLTLNYGKKRDGNNDIYIINSKSLNVYYLKGVMYSEDMHYTI